MYAARYPYDRPARRATKARFVVENGVAIDTKYRRALGNGSFTSAEARCRALNGERPLAGDLKPQPEPKPETLSEAARRRNWTRCRELLRAIGSREAMEIASRTCAFRDFDRTEMLYEDHEAMTLAILRFDESTQAEQFSEEGC